MTEDDNPFPINEKEVMEYYGYSGRTGSLKIKTKFLRSWILHSLAYSTPSSGFAVKMQKMRGVKIGRNCHFNPYVLIDLIYPELVNIGDNVTLGSHSMIFAHSNPSANLFLKNGEYPRKDRKSKHKIWCSDQSWRYSYCRCHCWRKFNYFTKERRDTRYPRLLYCGWKSCKSC